MANRYANEHVDTQLRRVSAEAAHVDRLNDVYRQWTAAADIIVTARDQLRDYSHNLVTNVWTDEAGTDFKARVDKSVTVLNTWCDSFDTQFHRFQTLLHTLSFDYPDIVRNVTIIRDNCVRQAHADLSSGKTPNDKPFQEAAGEQLMRLDNYYWAAYWIQLGLASGTAWDGPRAALSVPGAPQPGLPATSTGAPTSSPQSAGTPRAAEVPQPQTAPENPAAPQQVENPQEATDPLAAAASALQAAQGLLGGAGTQVPDAIAAPGFDYSPTDLTAAYANGQPELAGLGGLGGGVGAASVGGAALGAPAIGAGTAMTGPGAGTLPSAGSAPVPLSGLAGGTASAAAAGASSPMMPPQSGAGAAAAGGRQGNRIKPGDAERPATGSRPRRRAGAGPVTPGVALAGRAGAAQPTPAARRGWDSENDSLRVLDEHLWQVNSPEEETHGQDRGRPGRDGHDRTAAHRAPDAGLVGPGRPAHQPTRAR